MLYLENINLKYDVKNLLDDLFEYQRFTRIENFFKS
jgi:hypothetical protein